MSYIRCLSNPEGLYIIAGISGNAEFFLNDSTYLFMPIEVFDGLLDKYVRQDAEEDSTEGDEVYKHQGASLMYLAPPEQRAAFGYSSGDDWKWFLHYEGWEKRIGMWDVTLDYIAQEARRQYEQELLLDSMEAKFADVDSLKPREALKLFRMWLKEPDDAHADD